MMLVTLNEILQIAEAKKCAIGSFNTPNLASLMAVIGAAEELNEPVIISHAEIHEELIPLEVIGPIMVDMAKKAKVPVCVHLDHGETLSYLEKALSLGFTSIMYDGSVLPYSENVANTSIAVEMAKKVGASVEAEIGILGKRELGAGYENTVEAPMEVYTNPDEAKRFVNETGIDALACSFGTAHGIYMKEPKLDMSVLEEIKKKVNIPLVMHGGSGVSEEDYKMVINKGIRKINYYTYMAKAGGEAISLKVQEAKDQVIYFHDVVRWGKEEMQENVKKAIKMFL